MWFDVEDLFEHVATAARPSGIQRVVAEILSELHALPETAGRMRCVRHDRRRGGLRVVPWPEVAALFTGLEVDSSARPSRMAQTGDNTKSRLRTRLGQLPPALRRRLARAVQLQARAWRATGALLVFVLRETLAAVRHSRHRGADITSSVRPGDVLVVLGAPWTYSGYATLLLRARATLGLRLAWLVYDIIPIRRPEWSDPTRVRTLQVLVTRLLSEADAVFAISRATADDVTRYAVETGINLPRVPITVLPLGSGFAAPPPATSYRLPPLGSYALFVSTMEARKKHRLLVSVWRRLLEELPSETVPNLVFAGRVGALVDDLLRELENSNWLGGKVRLIVDATDAELVALYRGCRFTLFPSLAEGWGLPVTESLAFGKPCLAARRPVLLEAGGDLARYFDPESVPDTYTAIRAVITDSDELATWEAEIIHRFVPTSWRTTAEALLRVLGAN